jgi:hypothetical protein
VESDLQTRFYQKLLLRPGGLSVAELATIFAVDLEHAIHVVDALVLRGLVRCNNLIVVPVFWQEEDHVELNLEVPRLPHDVFLQYCRELDELSIALKVSGIQALRPFAHETTLTIVLAATAGFALAEFAKGLLGELGKALAGFVAKSTKRHGDKGLTTVEIKGVVRPLNASPIIFTVTGADAEEVVKRFAGLAEVLNRPKIDVPGEDVISGNGWHAVVRRR